MTLPDLARHFLRTLNLANHPKRLGIDEAIDELPTLHRAIPIQDHPSHMLDVVIERVAERDHFDQRRKKHEEKRHWIAPDSNKFLKQDGAETTERLRLGHLGGFPVVFARMFRRQRNEHILERG